MLDSKGKANKGHLDISSEIISHAPEKFKIIRDQDGITNDQII